MRVVDMRCVECGEIEPDVVDNTVKVCDICGGKMKRLYGYRKYAEYPEGLYENFEEPDGKPVYIRDREHFWKEAKKRGLEPASKGLIKEFKDRRN